MRERWESLALREKQMVSIGAVALGIFLGFALIWTPFNNKVASLRTQIRHNQELLVTMQNTDKRIQILARTSQTKPAPHSAGSLLSIVQKQINRTPLVGALNQLHQVDNDSVQLTFQKVDFDKLIDWLIQVTQQEDLNVSQITVTPGVTPGIVSADLILKT